MKKSAKTMLIAAALTAAAMGLTACDPPSDSNQGVYGPPNDFTKTTASAPDIQTEYGAPVEYDSSAADSGSDADSAEKKNAETTTHKKKKKSDLTSSTYDFPEEEYPRDDSGTDNGDTPTDPPADEPAATTNAPSEPSAPPATTQPEASPPNNMNYDDNWTDPDTEAADGDTEEISDDEIDNNAAEVDE